MLRSGSSVQAVLAQSQSVSRRNIVPDSESFEFDWTSRDGKYRLAFSHSPWRWMAWRHGERWGVVCREWPSNYVLELIHEVLELRSTKRSMAETIVDGVLCCRLELAGSCTVLKLRTRGTAIHARVLQRMEEEGVELPFRGHVLVLAPDSDGYDVQRYRRTPWLAEPPDLSTDDGLVLVRR